MTLTAALRPTVVTLALVGSLASSVTAQIADRTSPEQVVSTRPNEMPAGQELDVRMQTPLDSDTAQAEDRFETTTVVDLVQDGRVLVPPDRSCGVWCARCTARHAPSVPAS